MRTASAHQEEKNKDSDIRTRLVEYGKYLRNNHSEYLGYPRINPIGRMIIQGIGAGQTTAPMIEVMPDEIEEIDVIIKGLSERNRIVILHRYADMLSIRKSAFRMGINREKYYRILKKTEGFISQKLRQKNDSSINVI